jgi:hypothetical protein
LYHVAQAQETFSCNKKFDFGYAHYFLEKHKLEQITQHTKKQPLVLLFFRNFVLLNTNYRHGLQNLIFMLGNK